jgi:hypothetical protein
MKSGTQNGMRVTKKPVAVLLYGITDDFTTPLQAGFLAYYRHQEL